MREDNSRKKKGLYYDKCDVRLNKEESGMLEYLSELNAVSRSDVMRRALRDYFKFNTDKGE